MSDIKHRDRILEAIDQLRRRKARPDSPRICNYMMRRFSVDCKDTKADLQRCVEKSIVYKVEYKGDISYRNAAKWNYRHKPSPTSAETDISPADLNNLLNNKSFINLITSAISELICQEPDYLELGVPGPALMKMLLMKSPIKYSKKHLVLLIQKEVDNGTLVKGENGHYSLGSAAQNNDSDDKSDDEIPSEIQLLDETEESRSSPVSSNSQPNSLNPTPKVLKKRGPKPGRKRMLEMLADKDFTGASNALEKSDAAAVGFRVGSRRKLAKKVFDPSDNNLPKRRRGRPTGSLNRSTIEKQSLSTTPNIKRSPPERPVSVASNSSKIIDTQTGGVCSVCHQAKKGVNEKLVSCRDCSNKAHPTCLNSEDGMLRLRPDNTWQCPHCKTCVICFETSDAGTLTVCSICSDAYHSLCHVPKIVDKSKACSKWICVNCQMPDHLIPNEIKPEIEKFDFDSKIHAGIENRSPTPSDIVNSNNQSTPTPPPTLSPQGNPITEENSDCSSDYKYPLSNVCNEENNDSNKSYEEKNYDPNIPDASNWTHEDVYQYFVQYFAEEDVNVFKEQEIDGHSLLLMKRADVLTNLNLRLGPALKIYRHVLKLQLRKDDPKLGWF